ncbi:MAG: hypothetical protein R3C29_17900 [Dehalococcoidia bacterium]
MEKGDVGVKRPASIPPLSTSVEVSGQVLGGRFEYARSGSARELPECSSPEAWLPVGFSGPGLWEGCGTAIEGRGFTAGDFADFSYGLGGSYCCCCPVELSLQPAVELKGHMIGHSFGLFITTEAVRSGVGGPNYPCHIEWFEKMTPMHPILWPVEGGPEFYVKKGYPFIHMNTTNQWKDEERSPTPDGGVASKVTLALAGRCESGTKLIEKVDSPSIGAGSAQMRTDDKHEFTRTLDIIVQLVSHPKCSLFCPTVGIHLTQTIKTVWKLDGTGKKYLPEPVSKELDLHDNKDYNDFMANGKLGVPIRFK